MGNCSSSKKSQQQQLRKLFERIVDSTATENEKKMFDAAVLQMIIYWEDWTPGAQNFNLDHVVDLTVQESVERVNELLRQKIVPDGADASLRSIVKTAMRGAIDPTGLAPHADAAPDGTTLTIRQIFTRAIDVARKARIDSDIICWHCGMIPCELPDVLPKNREERGKLDFKCRKALHKHLRTVGSLRVSPRVSPRDSLGDSPVAELSQLYEPMMKRYLFD